MVMQSRPSVPPRLNNKMEHSSFLELVPLNIDDFQRAPRSNSDRFGLFVGVLAPNPTVYPPTRCNTSLARRLAKSRRHHRNKNLLHNDEVRHRARWLIQSARRS